jgi:uncharacterized protein (DUF885 family)
MQNSKPFAACLALTFFSAPFLFAEPTPARAGDDTTKALHTFFDEEWDYSMEQNPTRASSMGDRRWNDRWNDDSLDAIRKREEHAKDSLKRFEKFERANLSPVDQLNYDLFKKEPRAGDRRLQIPHVSAPD